MTHDEPTEALRPAFDAFRRGTKRSRLRILAVVCPNGHTLLEVFPTKSGPVALWSSRRRWGLDDAGETVEYRPARTEWQAAFLQDDRAEVHCRCTEATVLDLDWVADQIAADTRRVLAPMG